MGASAEGPVTGKALTGATRARHHAADEQEQKQGEEQQPEPKWEPHEQAEIQREVH